LIARERIRPFECGAIVAAINRGRQSTLVEPVRTDWRSNSQTFLATFGDESEILGQ
jgi:hypothetical protein